MKDYRSECGIKYDPPDRFGYTILHPLDFLRHSPWDEIALAYVHALRPSFIRVTEDAITLDARLWRVTIYVDKNNTILDIEQEVEVALPGNIKCGDDLDERAGIYVK